MSKIVGFLGCGELGQGIIYGALKVGFFAPDQLRACVKTPESAHTISQRFGIQSGTSPSLLKDCDIVILGVRPQQHEGAIMGAKDVLEPHQLMITLAAGLPTARIAALFHKAPRLVRTMPNLLLRVGLGASAVARGVGSSDMDVSWACALFESLGRVYVLPESQIDAFTALCGCGPAYVAYWLDGMISAARKLGLPSESIEEMCLNCFLGTLHLLINEKVSPSALVKQIAVPGGATERAISHLDSQDSQQHFFEAVEKAYLRCIQLAHNKS